MKGVVMVDIGGAPAKPGLLENIKNFDMNGVVESIKSYPFDWVEVGTCAGIGLLSGFLFKKYFRTFVMTVIFGVLVIVMLDRLNLIHIDWEHLQGVVGIQPTQEAFNNLFQAAYAWVKINVQAVVSFSVGFIVGYKVG
jgi:uncharacterized membrane protein (Fun14 family)